MTAEKLMLKLAAHFLEELSSRMSNANCNDPESDVLDMLLKIDGIDPKYVKEMIDGGNGGQFEGERGYDWAIVDGIRYKLLEMAEKS